MIKCGTAKERASQQTEKRCEKNSSEKFPCSCFHVESDPGKYPGDMENGAGDISDRIDF